jgi:hypothetical protein
MSHSLTVGNVAITVFTIAVVTIAVVASISRRYL